MPSSAPGGSAARTAATSAETAVLLAALENRYSICASPEPPSAAISAGSTHACPVRVTEVAVPTTVRRGEPGTPLSVICVPGWTSPLPWPLLAHTTSAVVRTQRPEVRVRSSTGPPGEVRPVSVMGTSSAPTAPGVLISAVTVVSGNGPDAAVTPGSRVVAASRAAEAFDVSTCAATCAPC